MLLRLDRALRRLTGFALGASVAMVVVLAFLGTLDVVTSNLLRYPIPSATEFAGELLPATVLLALAHAQRLRAHITVDLLVRRLPAAGRQSAVLLTLLAGIVFFGALVWGAVPLAWDSWKLNEIAVASFQFPVWPGKIAFALGAVLGLVEIMRQLVWWCAGDREGAGGEAPAATAVEAI